MIVTIWGAATRELMQDNFSAQRMYCDASRAEKMSLRPHDTLTAHADHGAMSPVMTTMREMITLMVDSTIQSRLCGEGCSPNSSAFTYSSSAPA
jgi:hypothetical protein